MKEKGIDSTYEYIFNGVDRLIEIANGISPEFGKIISLQSRKETNSPNLIAEKNFFKKEFEKINYSNVSRTLVEMNELLQTYLIDSGEIKRDNRLYQIVKEFYPTRIGWEEFYSNAKDLPDHEILAKVYAVLPEEEINYQLQDNEVDAVKQMDDIVKMYADSSSPIKATTYGGMNFYSIMVAYDMYQKGIQQATSQDVLKYCNYLVYNINSEMSMTDRVLRYMDYIRTRCEKGKSIKEILDENLANTTVAYINMKKIRENEFSYWEKIEQTGDLIIRQNEENQEQFYYYFYNQILTLSQDYFNNGQLYNENDYEEFIGKMQKVFDRVGMPEVTKKVGETPEMLFVKSVSDSLQIFSDNFTQQIINLLDIIEEKEPNLGIATGKLDDLGFNINMAYETLEQSQSKLELKEFSNKMIVYFLNKGSRSKLREVTSREIRKGELNFLQPNKNIYQTIQNIIGTPEFWQDLNGIKEMFDKYPMIYQTLREEKEFINLLVQQLPEELQCKVKEGCPSYAYTMMREKINEVVLGTKYPSVDKFSPEKLKDLSPLVQFTLKYDVYSALSNEGKKDEAEKLFADGLFVVPAENRLVLDTPTVVSMTKNADVENCQLEAHQAFSEISVEITEKNQEINEKDIS